MIYTSINILKIKNGIFQKIILIRNNSSYFNKLKVVMELRLSYFCNSKIIPLITTTPFSKVKDKFKWIDFHFIIYIPLNGDSIGIFFGVIPDYTFFNKLKRLVKKTPLLLFDIRLCVISLPSPFNFKYRSFIQMPFLKYFYEQEWFLDYYTKYFSFLNPIELFLKKYLFNDFSSWDLYFKYFLQDYFNNGRPLAFPYYEWSDFSFFERNYFLALFLYCALFSTWVNFYTYRQPIYKFKRKSKFRSSFKSKFKRKVKFKRKTLINTFISYRAFFIRFLYRRIVRIIRRFFK